MKPTPQRTHDRQYFYKYTTASTAKDVMKSRRLRWSAPSRFNDPFDVPRTATLAFTADELQDALRHDLIRVLRGEIHTNNPRLQELVSLVSQIPSAQREDFLSFAMDELQMVKPKSVQSLDDFREAWRRLMPHLRILCVSEISDSPLMWAYYADSHKGVVLEFEARDDTDSPFRVAEPVIYQDHPPALPGKEVWSRSIVTGEPIDWNSWFREYEYVKTTNWRHEREWRIVTYARDAEAGEYADWSFNARDLSAVILGASIPAKDESEIRELVRAAYPHAEIKRALIDHESRTVRISGADAAA